MIFLHSYHLSVTFCPSALSQPTLRSLQRDVETYATNYTRFVYKAQNAQIIQIFLLIQTAQNSLFSFIDVHRQ